MLAPGRYHHPGYGDLQIRVDKDGNLEATFQTSTPAQVVYGGRNTPRLQLPEYDTSFPLLPGEHGALRIPFEPACAPIEFQPVSAHKNPTY